MANRFSDWEPMGTGAGLSVNPLFPQYSEYAEGLKQLVWDGLSPVLLGVAGGGNSAVGGYDALKGALKIGRLSRSSSALRSSANTVHSSVTSTYEYEVISTWVSPVRRAEATLPGGLKVGEKVYKSGRFLPGSHTVITATRSYSHSGLMNPPIGGYNTIRPSPIFYPNLNPAARWAIGGGGTGLTIYWSINSNNPKK